MQRTSFDRMACPVARTLDVIGEWWTPLIVRDVALGITRFEAIQRNLGISRKVLAQRLNALVDHGVLERVPYQERPLRHDYRLTEKGADLGMVLLAMQAWGNRWVFAAEDSPLHLRHERCGETVQVLPTCSHCGEPLSAAEVTPVAGPGLVDGPGTHELAARLRA